jgi:hypothetical protein
MQEKERDVEANKGFEYRGTTAGVPYTVDFVERRATPRVQLRLPSSGFCAIVLLALRLTLSIRIYSLVALDTFQTVTTVRPLDDRLMGAAKAGGVVKRRHLPIRCVAPTLCSHRGSRSHGI